MFHETAVSENLNIRSRITVLLKGAVSASGCETDPSKIGVSHPESNIYGDFTTNIALRLRGGKQLANTIVESAEQSSLVSKLEVAGPGFINLWLSDKILYQELKSIKTQGDLYGSGKWGEGKKWLIEHTSPNPNKAMHFGHLRNNLIGMTIANTWENGGVEVIRDEVDNNRGISIAKLMWGYLKFAAKDESLNPSLDYWYEHKDEWKTPTELGIKPDYFVDNLYVKASNVMESNQEVERQIRQMVVDWENGDKKTRELWKKALSYSYEGQELTLKRLGNKWDYVWKESDHYNEGKDLVNKGLKLGIFRNGDNGTVLTNLSKQGLTDTVALKSDGTSLYLTQDLALTNKKIEKFHPDRLFWVIGPEQSLAMKQLFATCELLGIGKKETMTHLPYGFVYVKGSGKMSSRTGNAVFIDTLLDLAKESAKKMITNPNIKQEEKDKIAEIVGVGAIKYSILKVSRMQDVEVNPAEAVSLEGNSGPYIQYTYARIQSILRKSGLDSKDLNMDEIPGNLTLEESAIMRLIYRFPEVTEDAGLNYEPSLICSFIFELARKYNNFYGNCNILGIEDKSRKNFRLLLSVTVGQVLKNGLSLLGIDTVNEM